MSDGRKKILMLCDHPLVPSGVGTQARYLIEGLLKTSRYKFIVFGGAIKHPDYRVQQVAPEIFGEKNWIIHPVDGYGDKEKMRAVLKEEKPDAVLLFTDPRFFTWVWEMEDEIRRVCPILYWHVWDNDPTPRFNKTFYESTDFVTALSLKTYGLLQDIGYDKSRFTYIPHAVDENLFRPLSETESIAFKKANFGPHGDKKFVVFWNNRNARRKMTGDVIAAFAKFAKKVGKANVVLVMHTLVADPEGQNVIEVAKEFDIDTNLVVSEERISPEILNGFYNAADVTINIANNEGFGLSTLESLMAGTPIIAQMTGGLQFQVGGWWNGLEDFTDQDKLRKIAEKEYSKHPENFFGVPVFPSVRSCVGSQPIPFIYDDRVSHEDVVKALEKIYSMSRKERRDLGERGSAWAKKTFAMNDMISKWDSVLTDQLNSFKPVSGRLNVVAI